MNRCFNVPAALASQFGARQLVIRSHTPSELIRCAQDSSLPNILCFQLVSLVPDAHCFLNDLAPLPLELVLEEPNEEFPLLYNYADLVRRGQRSVVVPLVEGFAKAVKVAGALNFGVRMEIGDLSLVPWDELASTLDYYLHNPLVTQPIEFFHSAVVGFYRCQSVSLWEIQQESPKFHAYVQDDGTVVLSKRLSNIPVLDSDDQFLRVLSERLLSSGYECADCGYFDWCGGYFKMPDPNYSCHQAKILFSRLMEAAADLKSDYP